MLLDAKLSKQFWAEAAQAEVIVINSLPNSPNGIALDGLHGRHVDLLFASGCSVPHGCCSINEMLPIFRLTYIPEIYNFDDYTILFLMY